MKCDFLETTLEQELKNKRMIGEAFMCGTEMILMFVILILISIILWQKTMKILIVWKLIKIILECLLSTVTEIKENKTE